MALKSLTPAKLLLLAGIAILLYAAHAAFIPVALALLFALVLSGPVESLHRLKVPRPLSASVILIFALALLTGLVALLWSPAQKWYADAPQTISTIKQRFSPVTRVVDRLDRIGSSTEGGSTSSSTTTVQSEPTTTSQRPSLIFFATTRLALVSGVTFIIVTLFLLTGGPPMMARMSAALFNDTNAARVLKIIDAVRSEVGRFYATTALINLTLGCATTLVMMLLGMPTPYLWGGLAAILNFIPYAGSFTTLVIVTLVAFVTFDNLGHVALVSGSYLVLATIEGQIIQPLLVGRRLALNPLLVFLALWFGGFFWGIAGIALATPVLVALKVVAEHSTNGKALMEFLGPNDHEAEMQKPLGKVMGNRDGGKNRIRRISSKAE